jgi:hypothetical protein
MASGVAQALELLLRGLAETFLLINRRPHMATVTEVQRPIQSIINECLELSEVIVMVALVAQTHLKA